MKIKQVIIPIFTIIFTVIIIALVSTNVSAQNGWTLQNSNIYNENFNYWVGIGTNSPDNYLQVFGGNVSITMNDSEGGSLNVGESIFAKRLCDENSINCKDLSDGWFDGNSLDSPNQVTQNVVYTDNEKNTFAQGNIAALGTICDGTGDCIGEYNGPWEYNIIDKDLYYKNGILNISTGNEYLGFTITNLWSSVMGAEMLRLKTSATNAGSDLKLTFDTGFSEARIIYDEIADNEGKFTFYIPDGASSSHKILDLNKDEIEMGLTGGKTIIHGELVTDSIEVNGATYSDEVIEFGNGAKITTSATDIIIRLP